MRHQAPYPLRGCPAALPAVDSAEALLQWQRAGTVAAQALQVGRLLCVPGARLVDIATAVERTMQDAGLGLAFPCTLSLNSVAAHFTPRHDDATVLKEGDLVKVDCGAEWQGALSDNALTVEAGYGADGPHARLIEASQKCLQAAIAMVGPDVDLGAVGAAIEATAKEYGFRTLQNLSGHSLEPWKVHAGLTVPNVAMRSGRRPKVGDVLAIEPFVTTGSGRVDNSGPGNIYQYQSSRPLRLPSAKRLLTAIERHHPKLAFAERWLTDAVEPNKLGFNLLQLQREGLIMQYPALSDSGGGMVAQSEATVVVTENGCIVTTR